MLWLQYHISIEEYLSDPSAENLLALGDDRAQILVDSLAPDSPSDSKGGVDSLFKVASLYTTVTACHVDGCGPQVKSAVEQTVGGLQCPIKYITLYFTFLLDAILRPVCEAGRVNSLINELLTHIGLLKVNHHLHQPCVCTYLYTPNPLSYVNS